MTDEEKRIVCDNLNLVDFMIQKKLHISPSNQYYEDYQQEGRLGLILAVCRYNKDAGTTLSTYASTYIEGYVKKYMREFVHRRVHIPRSISDIISKISSIQMRESDPVAIQKELSITPLEYSEAIAAMSISSLEEPISSNSESDPMYLKDAIGIDDSYNFDEEIILRCIDKVADTCKTEKYSNIWYEYVYSLYYGEKVSTTSLASRYHVSQPQVSRVLNECRGKLKIYLELEGLENI